MKYRIVKETCYGKLAVFHAQKSRFGWFCGAVWSRFIDDSMRSCLHVELCVPVTYSTYDEAVAAIGRHQLGCKKEVVYTSSSASLSPSEKDAAS